MNDIYPMWAAAHGVMIICPVNWYQAAVGLKLMIDRLVCADGGNPDPTSTHGKDAERGQGDGARRLALSASSGRPGVLGGGARRLRRRRTVHGAICGWLTDMGLIEAGHMSQVGALCRLHAALRDEPRGSRPRHRLPGGGAQRRARAGAGGEALAPRRTQAARRGPASAARRSEARSALRSSGPAQARLGMRAIAQRCGAGRSIRNAADRLSSSASRSRAAVSTRDSAATCRWRSTDDHDDRADHHQQLRGMQPDQRAIAERQRRQRPDHDADDGKRQHDVERFAIGLAARDTRRGRIRSDRPRSPPRSRA